MKQIKTITFKDPSDFDEAVNRALRDGWKLIKRSLVQSPAGFSDYHYAELERNEGGAQTERDCENCRYKSYPLREWPCRRCEEVNGVPDKWEPQ